MAFAEDMSVFFNVADFGVPAIFGEHSATVILDQPDAEIFDRQLVAGDVSISYVAGELEGLQKGSVINVDGIDYKVTHPPMRIQDGKLMQVQVTAA
jgi:hypothetical protein